MKIWSHILVLLSAGFLFQACCGCDPEDDKEKPELVFAVAGHVYGNPDTFTSSVYPPFLRQLQEDHAARDFDFLILTGDVVAHPTDSNWQTVKTELDDLGIPWYIAPGNHDISRYMDEYVQNFKYKFFRQNESLVMILNSSHEGWTLDSLQTQAVKTELANADSLDRIFVFTHQLWWERNPPPDFKLDSLRPNSQALYEGKSDFWQDVFPYFEAAQVETWFFAGDMGSHYSLPSYYEDHHGRFHFYGSGMGGGIRDNYLIVSVYQNNRVEIEKIPF